MPQTSPSVIPMISYEDGLAALDWLAQAFGFRERTRMTGPDGKLAHGEMDAGDGVIMLATPTPDYQNPKRHREQEARPRRVHVHSRRYEDDGESQQIERQARDRKQTDC